MIDVTPLFKYEVYGPDAGAFLARVMSKDVRKLKQNQVTYLCWCDDDGKVADDGTVTRLEENYYRVTAAEPSLSWFHRFSRGYDITIEDSSKKIASLAVQGPNSRALLAEVSDANMNALRFFRGTKCSISSTSNNLEAYISRTGYTGDLGYEIWVKSEDAVALWDTLMTEGKKFGIEPAGLDALDVSRIEAGFIMNGVDYFSSNHCIIDSRKSSPFELGLDWTVKVDREPFNGQEALKRELANPSEWAFAGIDIDWVETEQLYAEYNLPPQVAHGAWRTPVPIYNDEMKQIGYATSGSWSPTLKKNLALATIQREYSKPGQKIKFEMTAEFERRTVTATVGSTPFFNPERKRSNPDG